VSHVWRRVQRLHNLDLTPLEAVAFFRYARLTQSPPLIFAYRPKLAGSFSRNTTASKLQMLANGSTVGDLSQRIIFIW
jgi:hypothetical protein